MILHTLNKAPQTPAAVGCLNALGSSTNSQDSLLLLEDGVYLAGKANEALVEKLPIPVFAVEADIEARGLVNRMASGITLVTYVEFVELVTEHKMTKSWL